MFLDYLRNQRGATAMLPFSARAREGAPVAAPVAWGELEEMEGGAAFHRPRRGPADRAGREPTASESGEADQILPDI